MKQYVFTALPTRSFLFIDIPQTSALDTHTEQALLQNINSILKEEARTSVFVAHRLQTISDSDKIIVLKDGCVAEEGTHSELIEAGGVYSDLWHGKSRSNPRVSKADGSAVQETSLGDLRDTERETAEHSRPEKT